MNEQVRILKRWATVCFLLCIQLAAGFMPVYAAHRHLVQNEISILQMQQDRLLNLVQNIPVQLEADDDGNVCWHITKHRRKTRFYLYAASPQVSTASRVVYLDTDGLASIYLPENKTGEYVRQKSFLPAYYTFLFRFTPF
jgi:hypothetical protein